MQRLAGTVLLLMLLAGCDRTQTSGSADPPAQQERTWAEQVQAVRAGESVEIRVETAPVTDADLEQLAGLEGLRRLNLGQADITAAGLEHIAAVPGLQTLRLVGADLHDPSLKHLQHMHDLRHLMLYDLPITDQGLTYLHELDALESFYFTGTRITDAGIRDLTAANPQLHVHW